MTELLSPGVYTIETSFRARSIQGVGTSTTGFVGLARSGPVGGPPQLVTSYAEFERVYGGLSELDVSGLGAAAKTNYLAHAVRAFFNEMGSRLYISRAFVARDETNDTGHASVLLRDDGVGSLTLASRFPGAAGNGSLEVTEATTPATDAALENAAIGSVARSLGSGDSAASLAATAAPGMVVAGSTLEMAVDGGATQTVTIAATEATVVSDALGDDNVLPAGTVLTVTVDGLRQRLSVRQGTVAAPATLRQIRNDLRANLQKATIEDTGGVLTITSSVAGAAISIVVEPEPLLGFPAQRTSTGTGLPRLDKISANDLNALMAGDGVTGVRANSSGADGRLILTSDTAGASSSVDISATDADTVTRLGFAATSATGSAGAAQTFFVRETGDAAGWRMYVLDVPTQDWQAAASLSTAAAVGANGMLVNVNLTYTNADGTLVNYDGMSLVSTHPRWMGARMKLLSPTDIANGAQEPVADPLTMDIDGLNAINLHQALFGMGDADGDGAISATHLLNGGNDGELPSLADWEGALEGLNRYDDIAIVAAPGSSAYSLVSTAMRKSLGIHAAGSGFRIAVIDPPLGQSLDQLRTTRGEVDNSYSAFYAPWIRIANPLARPGNENTPRDLLVPPSGHICGIYARNDALRGVHKTPANEVIRSSLGFETDYNQAQQGVLNPLGINCLRTLKGRGNRVYGGRLATSDREVLYVSDRRYLNYIKRSIYESMQWAVFEPNGPDLWANVREAVSSFLYNEWFNGALFGTTQDEAYFAVCDGSVMTQQDLDTGRMNCEIGLALLKPAEFVVFSIGQKTADARR